MKYTVMIFLFAISCGTNKSKTSTELALVATIDFQDDFNNDRVSASVNGCLILDSTLLLSDKIDGMTNTSIVIEQKTNGVLVANDSELDCQLKNNSLKIDVVINDSLNSFEISLEKGRYIGFDKIDLSQVRLNQSKNPFEYD